MNEKQELKVVSEYLQMAKDHCAFERKYSRIGFIGGSAIALGFWFKQIAVQSKILSVYLSKDLLNKRINELST